jgi:outer membrane protein assembly factor BamB
MVSATSFGADQPHWGQRHTRNMVSEEKGLAKSWDPRTGENIKWSISLGTATYSTPIIAGGRVLIGTNNAKPRNQRHQGDFGVLMCFDEKDDRFCWQLLVPKLGPSPYLDWPRTGLVSPCTVEGKRVYLVSNRNEVMCLDLAGLANGNDGPYQEEGRHMGLGDGVPQPVDSTDADIIWLYDIDRERGVHQHDAAHCSILLNGQYLYVNTSNGVDDTHGHIPSPEAPSLMVLDKTTGRLVAQDDEHMVRSAICSSSCATRRPVAQDDEHMALRTIHCTWSSPALGEVNGRALVFFGGGDGVCYAFEAPPPSPPTGQVSKLKKVWWFDCDASVPKENVHQYQDNRREGPSNIMGMPVFYRNRVYVAAGGDLWHGKRKSWLKCIDATKNGEITSSGEVWSYAMDQHCMSTPAIADDLVFIADCRGGVHCLDANTGRPHWTHETQGEIWGSTLVADGKVYVGNRSGDLWVLAASKRKKVIGSIEMGNPIHATPTVANGALYIATMKHLYAIGNLRQH